MTATQRLHIRFSLVMLLLALLFGAVSSFAFLYPKLFNKAIPFYQLRPMHVSAVLFWIITAATAGILYFKQEVFRSRETMAEKAFVRIWIGTIITIFGFYAFRKFGGREYWEFPPFLCLPILAAWLMLMYGYFRAWRKREASPPLYVWMWTTGIVFFLITFLEQNLYQIAWFRNSFLRDLTVQWKSNGAMVGAWNQMIYGTSLYVMTRVTGDENLARNNKAFLFYFIGLGNLMLNWGHHIYNVPGPSWIRHTAYAVSMTEWIVFISIVIDYRKKLHESRKYRHLLVHRFIISAEWWAYLNLLLALMMSVPAINRYTHGTHITVAHAMGATIGINTMILLGALGYILRVDELDQVRKTRIRKGFTTAHISLLVFWTALMAAGILKGYRTVALGITDFSEVMKPVSVTLHLFAFAGLALLAGMTMIVAEYMRAAAKRDLPGHPKFRDEAHPTIIYPIQTKTEQSLQA